MNVATQSDENTPETSAEYLRSQLDEMGYADLSFDPASFEIVHKLYSDLCDSLQYINEHHEFELQQQQPLDLDSKLNLEDEIQKPQIASRERYLKS